MPSTGKPARKASSSCRAPTALIASFRESVSPPVGGDNHGLNAVADSHFEPAVRVLQLGEIDLRLALPANVHERDLGSDRDDPSLDGLSSLEAPGLGGRLE